MIFGPDVYIKRGKGDDQGTIGALYVPELQWSCWINELPDRNNEKCFGRILPGKYFAIWVSSPKHGWVYLLQRVPDRSAILMHAGNFAGDTRKGWLSDVLGCLEFGHKIALMKGQRCVINSRSTRDTFQKLMNGMNFYLNIE